MEPQVKVTELLMDEQRIPDKTSDEVEQKIWDVIRQVPGLNIGYGSVRLIIYIGKGNKKEVLSSATGVAKGLVETAAIVGCYFVAPVVAPIAAGALTGVVTSSIKGMANVVVVMIENPGELSKIKGTDEKEKFLYKEIKDIPAVGAAYSVLRFPIYLVKGNKIEAVMSGVNSVLGGASSVVKCGGDVIHLIDKETEKALEKLSQIVVPLVSKKVMEKVVSKEISLDEGVKVVEAVEVTCEAVAQEVSRRKSTASIHEKHDLPNADDSDLIMNDINNVPTHKSQRCLPKICRLFKSKGKKKSEVGKKETMDEPDASNQTTSDEVSSTEAVILVI